MAETRQMQENAYANRFSDDAPNVMSTGKVVAVTVDTQAMKRLRDLEVRAAQLKERDE